MIKKTSLASVLLVLMPAVWGHPNAWLPAASRPDPGPASVAGAEGAPWKPFPVPLSITVQQALQAAPDGWTVGYLDRPHVLTCVTLYDGRPEDLASLVYDGESAAGPKRTLKWRLKASTPEGIWIECHYAGTVAVLRKRLPAGVTECAVTSNRAVTIDGCEEIERIEIR